MKIGQLKNIEIQDNTALISINPNIYSLSAIFSAAYCLCEKAYIILDGNPVDEVLVEITPKDNTAVLPIVHKFNEELINYIVYEVRDERNREMRESIMQRILFTNKYRQYKDILNDSLGEKWEIIEKEKTTKTELENQDDDSS